MEKICTKCNLEKSITDFYKSKLLKSGVENICKECKLNKGKKTRLEQKKDPLWIEKERSRAREKYHRLGYSEKQKCSPEIKKLKLYKHRDLYPEKHKAIMFAKKIPSNGNHKHHWSYNKQHWLDIIFLNVKDHLKAHRFIIYDQERMMYRDLNGKLLDSKEKHLSYILEKIENEKD